MVLEEKNKTKQNLPKIGYQKIADLVLLKDYELSLVFVSKKFIKEINNKYRQKNYPTNILSFPFSKKEGEIFICPIIAKEEAKKNKEKLKDYLTFLFIHGITHLKGFEHGSRMEREEEKIRKIFLPY